MHRITVVLIRLGNPFTGKKQVKFKYFEFRLLFFTVMRKKEKHKYSSFKYIFIPHKLQFIIYISLHSSFTCQNVRRNTDMIVLKKTEFHRIVLFCQISCTISLIIKIKTLRSSSLLFVNGQIQ